MWRNYLITGVRALAKNRAYALINILGLAIGMAACLVILVYVRYERSWDSAPGTERSYQLQTFNTDPETGAVAGIQGGAYAVGMAMRRSIPEVETVAYLTNSQATVLKDGEPLRATITRVEPGFLSIYPLAAVRGRVADAMRDTNSVAMSEASALRFFGTPDVVGRTLATITGGEQRDMRVVAVFRDLPLNSHQDFSMLARFEPARQLEPDQEKYWSWISGNVYVRLKPGASADAVNGALRDWSLRLAPREDVGGQLISQVQNARFVLTPFAAIHLGEAQQAAERPGNDAATIATFAAVALLILAMACINFTNLATARASRRAREIALRKVLGAGRGQLVLQFLTESVLVAAVALLIAAALAELALPWLGRFLDADLALHYVGRDGLLPHMLALVLVVGVVAGLYPALVLSRYRPAQILRANQSAAETGGAGRLRNLLVVVQFAVSIGLIACTAVVYAQTAYARRADVGFDRGRLLQVEDIGRTEVQPLVETLQREVSRVPGVAATARTSIGLNTNNRSMNTALMPGRTAPINIGTYSVQPGFFEAMGIRLIAGRTLGEAQAIDDATVRGPVAQGEAALVARGLNVVVNAAAARRLGLADPAAAVGRTMRISLVDSARGLVPATIVGVVADTRYRSLREPMEPIVYFRNDQWMPYLEVRVAPGASPSAVRAGVEAVWKRMLPRTPFRADFLDDRGAELYEADAARATIFAAFAVLAVVVGCLGLFGLAAFTAERRTKEIGIRKVLGARTQDIVRLLVWQFSRPVLLANLLAWPAAWWAMRDWLNQFDVRVGLGPAPFVGAGLLALAIAVATIAGHAVRVARASPVRALRYE